MVGRVVGCDASSRARVGLGNLRDDASSVGWESCVFVAVGVENGVGVAGIVTVGFITVGNVGGVRTGDGGCAAQPNKNQRNKMGNDFMGTV